MTERSLWDSYVAAHQLMVRQRMSVRQSDSNSTSEIGASLLGPAGDCAAALDYLPFLPLQRALPLLPTLVKVALSVHGLTEAARTCLTHLPSGAVIQAVSIAEAEVVRRADYEEYACLFEIWRTLGHLDRATNLARQATEDADEDVREVASAFLLRTGEV